MATWPDFCTMGVALRVTPRSSYWICGTVTLCCEPRYWLSRLEALTPLTVMPASEALETAEPVV